jgi:hypothetical protein
MAELSVRLAWRIANAKEKPQTRRDSGLRAERGVPERPYFFAADFRVPRW